MAKKQNDIFEIVKRVFPTKEVVYSFNNVKKITKLFGNMNTKKDDFTS